MWVILPLTRTVPCVAHHPSTSGLPRVLGLGDAVMIVVGSIIGSGIFLKPGIVAKELPGSFGLILLVWIGVGLVTLCGALALAELAAMLPHAGGPYVYLREAFGRLPAFLWGWTEFWIIRTASIGALAQASVEHLNKVAPLGRRELEGVAIAIIVGLAILNIVGTRWGARVQNVTVVIKVGLLAGIILLPLVTARADVANLSPWWPEEMGASLWRGLGLAMIAVLWPYDGWVNLSPIAEEIHKPQRNIPRALALGMCIVIGLYVSANVAYHLVLPMEEIARSKTVAADVCQRIVGDWGGTVVALGVMISTFGAVNSNMLTGPRIYFAMARDGMLPASICQVHARFQTPAHAIALQSVWAVALLVAAYDLPEMLAACGASAAWVESVRKSPFDTLTDFVIFGGSLFYAMAVGAVVVLRVRRPDLPRPYRTWGFPWTPLVYLALFAAVLVSLLIEKPVQTFAGSTVILAGVVFYRAWSRWQPRP